MFALRSVLLGAPHGGDDARVRRAQRKFLTNDEMMTVNGKKRSLPPRCETVSGGGSSRSEDYANTRPSSSSSSSSSSLPPRAIVVTHSTYQSGMPAFPNDNFTPPFNEWWQKIKENLVDKGLSKTTKGIRSRLDCDSNFLFKLLAEICIDELITLSVLIWVTGNPFTNPEAWSQPVRLAALIQLISAALNDTLIVYFLAPTSSEDGDDGKKGTLAHLFQEGNYTTKERVDCYFSKARFYFFIGATTCTIATFLAEAINDNLAEFNIITPILLGGIHMSVSANTRYQIVNGIECVMYKNFPDAARAGSVILRTSNNFLGARLWIVLSSIL